MTIKEDTPLFMSAGRDYNSGLHGRYEYCVFAGEGDDAVIVARKGGFTSNTQAKRAGMKAALALRPSA